MYNSKHYIHMGISNCVSINVNTCSVHTNAYVYIHTVDCFFSASLHTRYINIITSCLFHIILLYITSTMIRIDTAHGGCSYRSAAYSPTFHTGHLFAVLGQPESLKRLSTRASCGYDLALDTARLRLAGC